MKLTSAAAKGGRGAVRERQRRDRAVATPMRVKHPEIATLQISFQFSDRTGFPPSPQVTVFHPPAQAYFCFACPYNDCDGEFDLASPVRALVESGERESKGEVRCAGTRYGSVTCSLCLEYSISTERG